VKAVSAVLTALFLVTAGAGPAYSQALTSRITDASGAGVTTIDVDRLYPTAAEERVVFVEVGRDVLSGEVAIVIDGLQDFENGCLRPETNAGDVTCGADDDQGELSSQLLVTLTPGRPAIIPACDPDPSLAPVTDTLAALNGRHVPIGIVDNLDRSLCLIVRQELPDRPDNNLVQGDTSSYDLRIVGDLQRGETKVEPIGPVTREPQNQVRGRRGGEGGVGGADVSGAGGSGLRGGAGVVTAGPSALPATGLALVLLLALVGWLLVTGWLLRRTPAPATVSSR